MSSRVGTRNGMPASRMRRFARTSRCAIVAVGTAKAGRDAFGIDAEHDLQHQRSPDAGVDRRVRADEQQLESLVGDRIRIGVRHVGRPHQFFAGQRDILPRRRAEHVALPVAGHGEQPPFRVRRGCHPPATSRSRARRRRRGSPRPARCRASAQPGWRAECRGRRGRRCRRPPAPPPAKSLAPVIRPRSRCRRRSASPTA